MTVLFYLALQHMCSLESEFESQMGEFHVKMKGKRRFFLFGLPNRSSAFLLSSFALGPVCIFQAWLGLHVCVQVTSMR